MTDTPNFFSDYLAAWATNDVDLVMRYFSDDVEFLDVTMGHGAKGVSEMRTFVENSFLFVPDATFEYLRHFESGDDYAIEWVMRLQPSDPGIPGVSIGRRTNGLISRHRDYWNGAAMHPSPS